VGENLRDCQLHVSPNSGEAKSEDTIRMSPQTGNGKWGGPSGRGVNPGSELEQLIEQGQERFKQVMPDGNSSKVIIFAVVALLIGAWTAYYTVPSDSVAVVQRFGKYVKEVQPGLHFKLPLGIDTATKPCRWKTGN
jgi:membrane protease subunit HflK